MAEEEGKPKEEKFDFTPEGESLGYISLDQARVLAMRTARETPGAYGRRYTDVSMAFESVEDEETEDHYVVTLSFRPEGAFTGTPGREQFFIEKEGNLAVRQVLSLPGQAGWRRIPVGLVAIGLVVVLAGAIGGVFAATSGGGGDSGSSTAASALPTSTLEVPATFAPVPTIAPMATPITQPTPPAPLATPTPLTSISSDNTRSGSQTAPSSGWIPVGDMLAARIDHTATILPGGKVLIVGGAISAELYDPVTRRFSLVGNPFCGHGRDPAATALADGRVLITGGKDDLRCAEVYDSRTGAFSKVGDLNADHWKHTATLLGDGRVLIAGGYRREDNAYISHPIAEIYDPVTETFTLTGKLNTGRVAHTSTLLPSGQVLITAGEKPTLRAIPEELLENQCLSSAELYNPLSGTFSAIGGLRFNGCTAWAMLLNDGNVLIMSASGRGELFEPATSTFRATGVMRENRYEPTAILLSSGQVLITGGNDPPIATAEIYDPATETFSFTDGMGVARYQHTATLLTDGSVLVTGAYNSALPSGEKLLRSAELWIPSNPSSSPSLASATTTPTPATARAPTTPPTSIPGDDTRSGSATVPTSSAWIPVGDMLAARTNHTATLLPDGKVLIVGGPRSAELYDPDMRRFLPLGNPFCVHGLDPAATLLADGRVLITGGGSDLRCAEVYDPESESFFKVGDLNAGHWQHTATLLGDGKVLIAGGWQLGSGGYVTQAVSEIYDPVAATFSLTGSLNISRGAHTAALLPSGQVFVIGGLNNDSPMDENCAGPPEVYDPGTGRFSSIGGIPDICSSHGTLLDNGNVLFTQQGSRPAIIVKSKDGTARDSGNMTAPRQNHSGTLLPSGQVLIAGGQNTLTGIPPLALVNVEIYDPATETFSVIVSMNQARAQHTATLLSNGQVLVTGGGDPDGRNLRSAELWIPISPASTPTPTPVVRGAPMQPPAVLVAWWPGDGNANDIVGGNHGTLRGSATFAPGMVGQAFSFDGQLAYVEVANASNLQISASSPSTLDTWIFPTSFPSVKGIPDADRAAPVTAAKDGYYALQYFDANEFFRAHVHTGTTWIDADAPFSLALDTWTHVAQTWDGTTLKIYVNGQLIGSGATSGPGNADRRNLFIGTIQDHLFAGRIDEVSIYNRALSHAEIRTIYDAGSGGKIK